MVPAERIHSVKRGDADAAELATYVVEKAELFPRGRRRLTGARNTPCD
jgi:hypothetical protein